MNDQNMDLTRATQLGDMPRSTDKRPDIYPAGRVCAVNNCGTKLSIYNGNDICARFNKAHIDHVSKG